MECPCPLPLLMQFSWYWREGCTRQLTLLRLELAQHCHPLVMGMNDKQFKGMSIFPLLQYFGIAILYENSPYICILVWWLNLFLAIYLLYLATNCKQVWIPHFISIKKVIMLNIIPVLNVYLIKFTMLKSNWILFKNIIFYISIAII